MEILRQQFLRHIGQTSPSPMLVEVARAEGVCFFTPEGKRYYDIIAGVSVSNVGHGNPAVTEAVCRQARDYMHVMVYGELVERPQVRYAARIAEYLPVPLDAVYFVNSGAEAVEGALKLAKRFTGRRRMVACRNAYHGSTHGAMSVMESREFSDAYGPMLPGVDWIRFNEPEDLGRITEETACVLVEPVQGEAGVRIPQEGYLEALRRRCDEVGTLLIFDEIQTGFGRTGEMFAMSKYGVTPDIVCLAKALGGGMPLGAFVSSGRIMECISHDPALGHITTFGGHPVCCAATTASPGDGAGPCKQPPFRDMATGIPCGQPSLQGCVKYAAIYDGLCPGSHAATDPSSIAAIGQEPTRVSYSLPFSPPRAFYPGHVPSSTLAPTGPDKNDHEKSPGTNRFWGSVNVW